MALLGLFKFSRSWLILITYIIFHFRCSLFHRNKTSSIYMKSFQIVFIVIFWLFFFLVCYFHLILINKSGFFSASLLINSFNFVIYCVTFRFIPFKHKRIKFYMKIFSSKTLTFLLYIIFFLLMNMQLFIIFISYPILCSMQYNTY